MGAGIGAVGAVAAGVLQFLGQGGAAGAGCQDYSLCGPGGVQNNINNYGPRLGDPNVTRRLPAEGGPSAGQDHDSPLATVTLPLFLADGSLSEYESVVVAGQLGAVVVWLQEQGLDTAVAEGYLAAHENQCAESAAILSLNAATGDIIATGYPSGLSGAEAAPAPGEPARTEGMHQQILAIPAALSADSAGTQVHIDGQELSSSSYSLHVESGTLLLNGQAPVSCSS